MSSNRRKASGSPLSHVNLFDSTLYVELKRLFLEKVSNEPVAFIALNSFNGSKMYIFGHTERWLS